MRATLLVWLALFAESCLCVRLSDSDSKHEVQSYEATFAAMSKVERAAAIAHTIASIALPPGKGDSGVVVPIEDAKGPIVLNEAKFPIVLYLERGYFFNSLVLQPGEAGSLFNKHPRALPFGIVAEIGNQPPSSMDSLRNFAGNVVVPVSFLVAAATAPTTGGASVILPWLMMSAMQFTGTKEEPSFMTDKPYLKMTDEQKTRGDKAAGMAKKASEFLVRNEPKKYMAKLPWQTPGNKVYLVSGGPDPAANTSSDLTISLMGFDEIMMKEITVVKQSVKDRSKKKAPKLAFRIEKCGYPDAIGSWTRTDYKHMRPRFRKDDDENLRIQWNWHDKVWRMLYKNNFNPLDWFGGTVLYEAKVNSGGVPLTGWQEKESGLPLPEVNMVISSELAKADQLKIKGLEPTSSNESEKAPPTLSGPEMNEEGGLENEPIQSSERTELPALTGVFEDAPVERSVSTKEANIQRMDDFLSENLRQLPTSLKSESKDASPEVTGARLSEPEVVRGASDPELE